MDDDWTKAELKKMLYDEQSKSTFWFCVMCLMFVPAIVGASFIARLLTCAWLGWCFTWGA